MSLTLVEASKYSNDVLAQGVVEKFVYEDPILERLQFKTIVGNALKYNRETTMAAAEFYAANDAWNTSEPVVTPYTATLKILGGAVDLDDFLRTTRSDINDLKKELLEAQIKAVKKEFMDALYYGNETTNPKEFDGLHVLLTDTTYNTILVDANDGADDPLSLTDDMDAAIDMIKGFKPTMIISSRAMRRGVTKYLRSVGAINTGRDEFSRPVVLYNDIPWYVSDYILDTELTSSGAFSASTGGHTTSIFILTFADDALCGLHSRAMETVPWALLDTNNCERARIRWYCGMMMKSLISCAKIVGIDVDGVVTA